MSARTLTGGCHCGAISYTIQRNDERTDGKWSGIYCYCDDCRLTLGFFFALLISPATNKITIKDQNGALVRYKSSARAGARIAGHAARASLGSIELEGYGKGILSLFNVEKHLWLQSQHLGGIASTITAGGPWEVTPDTLRKPKDPLVSDEEILEGGCHCGGIKFTICRPPADFGSDPVLAKWVKAGRQISANHCWCDTCRLVSGAAFWTWAFVPVKLLTFTSTATERIYNSHKTKPIQRRFCGRCGCTYSYEYKPGSEMWDMSVATFDLKSDKVDRWLAFGPTPGGDPADEELNKYINGWMDLDKSGRPFSYVADGEIYNPEMVEMVRRGRVGRWVVKYLFTEHKKLNSRASGANERHPHKAWRERSRIKGTRTGGADALLGFRFGAPFTTSIHFTFTCTPTSTMRLSFTYVALLACAIGYTTAQLETFPTVIDPSRPAPTFTIPVEPIPTVSGSSTVTTVTTTPTGTSSGTGSTPSGTTPGSSTTPSSTESTPGPSSTQPGGAAVGGPAMECLLSGASRGRVNAASWTSVNPSTVARRTVEGLVLYFETVVFREQDPRPFLIKPRSAFDSRIVPLPVPYLRPKQSWQFLDLTGYCLCSQQRHFRNVSWIDIGI
ncbi:hypothetical protein BKA62DRAFT_672367 [Auriculariales sp. MPI-PUGE-AT-0066]|nr:hypothetical protein BKA62DRAFT_672367 [Auriculariales sp. MPI-PUGE-AT-0066]